MNTQTTKPELLPTCPCCESDVVDTLLVSGMFSFKKTEFQCSDCRCVWDESKRTSAIEPAAAGEARSVDAVLLEDMGDGYDPKYGKGLFTTHNCVRQVYLHPPAAQPLPAGAVVVEQLPEEATEQMVASVSAILTPYAAKLVWWRMLEVARKKS